MTVLQRTGPWYRASIVQIGGICCDIHDICIRSEMPGARTMSGNGVECAEVKYSHVLRCLNDYDPETWFNPLFGNVAEIFPLCSPEPCQECHREVTECVILA